MSRSYSFANFKILFFILLIVTFSSNTALADGINCQSIGETAKLVMWYRQNGTAIASVMEAVDKEPAHDMRKLMKTLVIKAYEQPLYRDQSDKEESISEFGNWIELLCLKNKSEMTK